jgi:hypothetical protein
MEKVTEQTLGLGAEVDVGMLGRSGCPAIRDGLTGSRESQILPRLVRGGHPHFHRHTGSEMMLVTHRAWIMWA